VCEYRGTFENWRREKSTDFTCNLFYMSSDTALGIRYIPDEYKHVPNPCRHLINMTKRKEFARIWGKDRPTLKEHPDHPVPHEVTGAPRLVPRQ